MFESLDAVLALLGVVEEIWVMAFEMFDESRAARAWVQAHVDRLLGGESPEGILAEARRARVAALEAEATAAADELARTAAALPDAGETP